MLKNIPMILGTLALLAFHGTTTFAYSPAPTEVELSSYYQNSMGQEVVLLGGATHELLKIDMELTDYNSGLSSTIVNDLTFTFEGEGTREIEELRLYDHKFTLVDTVAWPNEGAVEMEVGNSYLTNQEYSFYLDAKFRNDFLENKTFTVGVTDADVISLSNSSSMAALVKTKNVWKYYSLDNPNNNQPGPSPISFERIPMVNVYHDDYYTQIKRNLQDTDPDTIVASFEVKSDVEIEVESLELFLTGNLDNAVSNIKVKDISANKWVQVSDKGNGKYMIYPDTKIFAGSNTFYDIYLDPNQNITDDSKYSGYVTLVDLDAESTENGISAQVSGLTSSGFYITVEDPADSGKQTLALSVQSQPVSSDLRFVPDSSNGNLVSQFKVTADSDIFVKYLTFNVVEVEGNALDYITKLTDGKGKTFENFGNGKFRYHFNSYMDKGESVIVNAYLDPSTSLPKNQKATGYVDLVQAQVAHTNSSMDSITFLPLSGWASMFTIYEQPDFDFSGLAPIELYPVNNSRYEWPIELQTSENPFSDISTADLNRPEVKAAIALEKQEVIGGYLVDESPLTVEFRGDNEVNRAEAAKFLINSMGIAENDYCHYPVGTDVEVGKWYTKYVCTANELGLMEGYSDGTFRPGEKVNTAEFAKMIYMAHKPAVNYSETSGDNWYSKYKAMAYQYDLFALQNGGFEPASYLSRFDVALAIFRIMAI